jgi:hypothetical protein
MYLLNFFVLKKMGIGMLLNNDKQLFFCSNDFKLPEGNKCN